jgi:hypothetical protein
MESKPHNQIRKPPCSRGIERLRRTERPCEWRISIILGASEAIVISQDQDLPKPRMQRRQEAGTRLGSVRGAFTGVELPVKRNRDKVASQHHQIRVQVIDDFHCRSYWRRREILVIVKVAQLRDGEIVESGGQPRECDFDRFTVGRFGSRSIVSSPSATTPVTATPAAI